MMATTAPSPKIASLTTTVPTEAEAQGLARGLVEARLAACVQVEAGMQSHYRWKGALQAEPEVRLTIKTIPAARARVEDFIGRYHPYAVPQLLWQEQDASPAYAEWVRTEVAAAVSAPPAEPPPAT